MNLKPLAAASALALASVASHAATYNWGPHDLLPLFEQQQLSPVPLFFGDTFNFTLSTAVTVKSGVAGFGSAVGGYSLLDSANNVLSGATPLSFGTLNTHTLGPGSYYYAVFGFAPTGGGYAITSTAAPVPEPETYAMLLAGLGVVGFVARRRKGKA